MEIARGLCYSFCMKIDPVALTKDLVRCPSITPENAGAQNVLREKLSGLGFECQDLPFGNIKNLYARRGAALPHICFCGHTDVVPPGDLSLWQHDPFAATESDGKIYGRGTADMKANIACFVAATSRFLEQHPDFNGSISLLITGDEEAEAINGTVKVLAWMKENQQLADFYLVGEPSNPEVIGEEIKIGRRGSLTGTLAVKGVQGHVAYPERAQNPLPALVTLLKLLNDHVFDSGTAFFPATNLEIVSIDVGNKADNVIPASGQARFNIRFNNLWNAQTLEQKIRDILDQAQIPYDLIVSSNAEAFMTQLGPESAVVVGAIQDVTGLTPRMATGGGTSDARFAAAYGPVIECGLINKTIHKVDEHVDIADIGKLTAIYEKILIRYFDL